jgi:hypothetical protein
MRTDPKPSPSLLAPKTNLLPLLLVVSLILQGLLLALTILNTGWMAILARKRAPTLVELADGESIAVVAREASYRSPQAIKNFVARVMSLLFTASGTLEPDRTTLKPRPDPGVSVDGSERQKVTTAAWEAGFALSEDFRVLFLRELAGITDRRVFAGTMQTWLSIDYLSEPELIEPGKWRLKMVATLYVFTGSDRLGKPIPVNKDIYVKAIEVTPKPLPESATEIQRALHNTRAAGLLITRLEEASDFTGTPPRKP